MSWQGASPKELHEALVQAADGYPEWVEELLAIGADPNGMPLIMAIQCDEPQIVKMMIDAGADVNQPYSQTTPLIRAITACYPSIVQLLLAAGADVNQRDSAGRSPLAAASGEIRLDATEEERNAIIRMLRAHGAQD